MDGGGLGGPGRWELVGVTEGIFVSLRPGADHLMRLGVSTFLGPLCTAQSTSQQNKDSEYKGQFGVGSGYSLSARGPSGRQGVLTKEIGGK